MFVVKPMQRARARIEGFISRLFKRTAAIETRVLSWSKKRRAFRETEQNASIEFCTKCLPDAMRPRMAFIICSKPGLRDDRSWLTPR